MKLKIIIERHAQSEGNAKKIVLGHTDLNLTEEGVVQAKITAEHLADEKIDAIYSSDLKRAYNTALPHAKMRGLEVVARKDLREVDIGIWDGMHLSRILADSSEDFARRSRRDFVYPGGEGVREASARLKHAILDIASENSDADTVLIVTHSVIIRAFWYDLLGSDAEDMNDSVKYMPNAAYAVLEYEDGRLTPILYSVSDHLPHTEVKPI